MQIKHLFIWMVLRQDWFWKCLNWDKRQFIISEVCNLYNSDIADIPCGKNAVSKTCLFSVGLANHCKLYKLQIMFHQVVNEGTMSSLATGSYMLIHVCSEAWEYFTRLNFNICLQHLLRVNLGLEHVLAESGNSKYMYFYLDKIFTRDSVVNIFRLARTTTFLCYIQFFLKLQYIK